MANLITDWDSLQQEAERAFSRGEDSEAFRLFLLCAEHGDALAQYNLAVLFAQGRGAERNLEVAERWAAAAWEQGLEDAKGLLGYILRKRSEDAGMHGDFATEEKLLKRAADLGNRAAIVKQAALAHDGDILATLRAEAKRSPLYQVAKALTDRGGKQEGTS